LSKAAWLIWWLAEPGAMLQLIALIIGLLAGLLATGRPRMLLLDRWRTLPVLFLALLAGLLQVLLARLAPGVIWTEDRLLLTSLIAVRHMLGLLFIGINIWPRPKSLVSRVIDGQVSLPATTGDMSWFHRVSLLVVAAGLIGEGAVMIANHGYMPIPEKYLQFIQDPVMIVGIRNEALLMKQLTNPQTHLAWLGQNWHWPLLSALHLSAFPFVSPSETIVAAGLALTGFLQFFSSKTAAHDKIQIKKPVRPSDKVSGQRQFRPFYPGRKEEGSKSMARKPWFSRPDGVYLKNIDPFMRFFPFIMKGRNESAVYFRQQIDVTALKAYISEKNRAAAASGEGSKSTLFHAVLAAMIKTIVERPQVNRFVIGRRIYQRNTISFAFVIKSEFRDDANEEIAVMNFTGDETLQTISARLQKEIHKVREGAKASSIKRHGAVDWLNTFMKIPRLLLRGFVRFLGFLDYHGWLPRFVIDADPMHTSIFVTNLGSLFIDAPFHHLYEWGTTSAFATIGVVSKAPVVMSDGTIAVRDVMNIGLTMDERISDGYYFTKTIKRFQYFLEHPLELEKPSSPGKV
jgi:hypothetical protein